MFTTNEFSTTDANLGNHTTGIRIPEPDLRTFSRW